MRIYKFIDKLKTKKETLAKEKEKLKKHTNDFKIKQEGIKILISIIF